MKSKNQKIIIGNWKMNPATSLDAKKLFTNFLKQKYQNKNVTTVICPPVIYIDQLRQLYSGSKVFFGAQDCFFNESGPYTGQISPQMLQAMKCRFVIIGHSERRALGETDEIISEKVRFSLKSGMHTVLCFGEKEQNEDGSHLKIIEDQLTASLKNVSKNLTKNLIVAYEPVWAISKGNKNHKSMDSHTVHQMALFVKKILIKIYGKTVGSNITIIYGGSSNASNAVDLITEGGVDGLLPGSASLDPVEFAKMIDLVSKAV